ncbi:unnamed protein product, partial [Meganyctiphanes norvegica]
NKRSYSKDHWDEVVSGEDLKTWTSLSEDLSGLSLLEFPRYSFSEDDPADLYLFCDSSKVAYGYAVYVVQKGKSNLVFAKPKVAPLKPKSLPTLELMSVFLAFKGLFSILKNLRNVKINNIFIAVDAQVVLSWLLSDNIKTKNLYAQNRVRDIQRMKGELVEKYNIPFHFRYVPTSFNPADLLTRGLSLETFTKRMKFWLQGPEWLSSNNVVWPTSDLLCLNSVNKSIVLNTEIGSIAKEILPLVSFEKYSKFSKLVGVTAKVIEALNKFKVLKSNKMQKLWDTTDPHQCAKIHVLKVMQKQSFPSEIDFILDPRNKKPPDLVNNLNLFIDRTGLMRSNGRIGKNKYFEYEVINPVLLAKDHLLTRRIIEEAHLQVKHLGIQATLNNVRLAGFWLTHPYQSVKNVINPCVICQKFNALSYRYPKVTNLPKHRVNFVRPYLHVGVDFTGHIMVREGKTEKKMYLLLFTCLNIRSVHMELLPDMTTGQFV